MLSGNSLRQTVHTHCASVHQAAKLVAALLRVVGVTAGLAESNGSLLSGLWLTSPAGWLTRTGISSGTLRSVTEYGLLLPFYTGRNQCDAAGTVVNAAIDPLSANVTLSAKPTVRMTYCYAVREGSRYGYGQHAYKFSGEVWACGFGDMLADRQTDPQTHSSQCSTPLPGEE